MRTSTRTDAEVLLRANDVVKHFPVRGGLWHRGPRPVVHAVDGVSLEVRRGETLGSARAGAASPPSDAA
jgi:ABC-type glutathione transport system ATPase component